MNKNIFPIIPLAGLFAAAAIGCGDSAIRNEPNTLTDAASDTAGQNPTGTGGSGTGGTAGVGGSGGMGTGGTGGSGGAGGTSPIDAGADLPVDAKESRDAMPSDVAFPRDLRGDLSPKFDLGSSDSGNICENGGACQKIATLYSSAVYQSQACTPNQAGQCTHKVASSLSCPGCSVWVNQTDAIEKIQNEWTAAGCEKCVWICPKISCRPLTAGICKPDLGKPPIGGGRCIDSEITPR